MAIKTHRGVHKEPRRRFYVGLEVTGAEKKAMYAAAEAEGRSFKQWALYHLMQAVNARKAHAAPQDS